ncbi:MAG: Sir2 family NAD+-dependent deacetylase [Acidobacteriota bacterium]
MNTTQSSAGLIVILTGAGISKESGLDTFRDPDGIWAKYNLEDVATPEAFQRNPALVQQFYNARRRSLLSEKVRPNAAHTAMAELERRWPGEVLVVTQNIDDLHERAGTRNLIHMHGELLKVRCERSGRVYSWARDLDPEGACECCGRAGTLRPHIVWFGEIPFELDRIYPALMRCNLFIAVGTSGQVYPAAGFVEEVKRYARARAVLLNAERTPLSPLFDEQVIGPASEVVPSYAERLLSEVGH